MTAAIALIALIGSWIFFSMVQIDTGYGGVRASFGAVSVDAPVLEEGLRFKKPWESIYELSHQQLTFHRRAADGDEIVVQADDNIPMNVDVSFHWVLNYEAMAWVRQQYGKTYWDRLVIPSAASAIRRAASEFENWNQLMEERQAFQARTTELFAETVQQKMRIKRIPEEIILAAFDFP